jgi:hypothetical protein
VAVALDVLRFRRAATFAEGATFLGHPDARVAAAAARCLSVVEQRPAAAGLLRSVLDRDPADALGLAVAESLLAMGDRAGLAFVRRRLAAAASMPEPDRLAYLRLLAIAGGQEDLALLGRSLQGAPADATVAGWSGRAELCPWLIASLAAANEVRGATGPWPLPFEEAAAAALYRITGAPLHDAPELGLARSPEAPAIDASAWDAFWAEAGPRFDGTLKYRFGQPYVPLLTVDELAGPSLPGARTDAALELAIVSGGTVRIETDDWVVRQSAALAEARARCAGACPPERRIGWSPGAFPA